MPKPRMSADEVAVLELELGVRRFDLSDKMRMMKSYCCQQIRYWDHEEILTAVERARAHYDEIYEQAHAA